jgi:hypothetical protein
MMPIWLLSLALKVRSIAGGIVSWAIKHPALTALIVVTALAAHWRHDAHLWHKVADQRGNALTDASNASKAELARAQAEHDAAAKQQKESNDAADHRVELARANDARRLADYERRLRAGASQGQRGAVPAAGQAGVAESRDGSGDDAVMATLNADMAICTENSRRLLEIHTEAVGEN